MKMFEPSQSLWRSRRQEPPCLPVQEQSSAVLALAERCYRGLPRKPADAAPAALTLHELRVQRGTESWWFAPAPGRTVMGLCLRLSYSQSPAPTAHPSHLPTQVQVQPHTACFPPPSFQLRQHTQRSLLTHHFHPGSSSLRCCVTAFQSVWVFWTGVFPGSRGILLKFLSLRGSLDIHLLLQTQREPETLYNLYRPRKDHFRVYSEVIIFLPWKHPWFRRELSHRIVQHQVNYCCLCQCCPYLISLFTPTVISPRGKLLWNMLLYSGEISFLIKKSL